ncbi:MAG: LysR family transcriptional regulator [Xanthomonadales bacterium]|nr:LysR family transcriptional regulator [Xanthomonadales bacterium]
MDRIEAMRMFVEAVRANGFAAAARVLDVPRSKVSKQIRALEEMLGVQLLMRTTRSLHLTDAGVIYYESAQELLAALEEAEEQVRGAGGARGTLRINAPISFGAHVLAPLLPRFHQDNPEVELRIGLSDQLIDPVSGGFDVSIRIADLKDSSLAARQIMPAPRHLLASPACLQRHGTPSEPEDLVGLPFLNYGGLQGGITLAFSRGEEVRRVRTRGPLMADNGDFLALMAQAGMGFVVLPEFICAPAVAAGRLVPVMTDWQAPPIAVHALFPQSRNMPVRVRRFVDFLVAELGQ